MRQMLEVPSVVNAMQGYSKGQVGKDCQNCDPGQYRTTNDVDSTTCIACPSGFSQQQAGQTPCLPCLPGEYQNETKQTSSFHVLRSMYSRHISERRRKGQMHTMCSQHQKSKCKFDTVHLLRSRQSINSRKCSMYQV